MCNMNVYNSDKISNLILSITLYKSSQGKTFHEENFICVTVNISISKRIFHKQKSIKEFSPTMFNEEHTSSSGINNE